jgi:hypothetical protein
MFPLIFNKNIGPFLAFTSEWFKTHQGLLLRLLNDPVLKYPSRRLLRITNQDCPTNERIVQIGPNYFSYGLRKIGHYSQITTDFRSHPKFAKRIYCAFRPLWWLCHAWDAGVADRLMPQLGFGFNTLTAYPDPNPEVTTFDGRTCYYGNYTWTQVRGNATANFTSDSAATDALAQGEVIPGAGIAISRCEFLFDTSGIGSDAIISAAILSVMSNGTGDHTEANYPANLALVSCNPASNTGVTNTDYAIAKWGTTRFASDVMLTTFLANTNIYSDMALNAAGLAFINKTGISKFGIRPSNDLDDNTPTARSYGIGYFADQAGITQDPKLVITYALPSGTKLPWLLFTQPQGVF